MAESIIDPHDSFFRETFSRRELIDTTVSGENTMQTFIDRYIEQGRQQGLFAGRQEGRKTGR